MAKYSKSFLNTIIILLLIILLIIIIKLLIDNKKSSKEHFGPGTMMPRMPDMPRSISESCTGIGVNGYYYPNIPNFIGKTQEYIDKFFKYDCGIQYNPSGLPFVYSFSNINNTNDIVKQQQYTDNTTPTLTDFTTISSYDMCAPIATPNNSDKNSKNFSVLFTFGSV